MLMKGRVAGGRFWRILLLSLMLVLPLAGCWNSSDDGRPDVQAPTAEQKLKVLSTHDVARIDEFYWLRDDERKDPAVLALISAENQYTQSVMAHTTPLQNQLFTEITARFTEKDKTVPIFQGDYAYHREFQAGGEQPIYVRHKLAGAVLDEKTADEVMLDVNSLARGHEYYEVSNWSVSSGQNLLAFTEDTVGRRQYRLRFKDIDSGLFLADEIPGVASSIAWAQDNKTVFYVRLDPQTLLPYQVYRHVLGTDAATDQLVYEETDRSFYTAVSTTRSNAFIVINLSSTDSTEIRLIDSLQPDSAPLMFMARQANHQYRIRHVSGTFYILTNWQAINFRLMKVDEAQLNNQAAWQEVIGHRVNTLLQDTEVFNDYLVVSERREGLPVLRVIRRDNEAAPGRIIGFPDPTYTARLHSNPEVDSVKLRYVYSSLTTPESVYEYDMDLGTSVLLKRDRVEGDFTPQRYTSERIMIEARDQTQVPVSLVYRTDLFKPHENPLYLNAYGAYGFASDAEFQSIRLSLLDRGFVFAIVHVRGGDELGRNWYENGRLMNKRNTFWDFMDATDQLVDKGYGDQDQVFAMGGSAGGLLMGVLANEAPEKYLGIIAHVPFVDLVTTMLDESIPLTTGEFSEWGDPRELSYFNYMLSYSPYDQVKAQDYPNMFVTAGLHDSQVQYFEPLKWVSRLRKMKTDDNLVLLDVNMDSGHGGASGRYARYQTDALEYAFVLDLLAQQ
ncbi:MAG: oligopeptidase B [Candidatus Azotimanducaceae bacterium]|jgi:oligopeptidase B